MTDLTNLGTQWKKPLKDQTTPYKIALMVLIEDYCTFLDKPKNEVPEEQRSSEKEEREFMFLLLELVQSSDMELKTLINKLQEYIKPHLLESLQARLKTLNVDGVSAVMDLFQFISDNLFRDPNPMLHRSSVLGLFIRRMLLAFDKLSFAQVTKLHNRYKSFYESWSELQQDNDEMNNSEIGDASLSIMEIMGTDKDDNQHKDALNTSFLDTGRYSQRQAEYFIAQQATLIQHNELEALSPKELQQKISELLSSNPELTEAHYLSYLNNLRIKEYCGGIERLVQYFDQHQVPAPTNGTAAKKPEEENNRSCSFAALNMAALHYQFGHRKEALAAVQEAIRIAQEANDHVCLQHALGWLQRFGFESLASVGYLLDRLVTKSGELNLPYLTSLGLQSLAKHVALTTTQPSSIFEFLLKSDIVNCQHSLSDLMCVSNAQKAALWHLYGRKEMCSINCQLMLHLNTALMGVYHNGDSECISLCHLSRLHVEQGKYDLAMDILATAKRRYPSTSRHSPLWMLFEQQLHFNRAILHGDWTAAEQAINNMAAVTDLEASYCQCVLLKEKGEASSAIELLDSLIEKYRLLQKEQQDLPEFYARLLILQAETQCGTGNAATAGQPLLACLTICRERHFSYMVAMTTIHLAFVQFSLGMPQQAVMLIEEVLTIILSHGSLYDRARSQYLWTKCQVAASAKKDPLEKRKARMNAVESMNAVIVWFKQIEAHSRHKDAVYYQDTTMLSDRFLRPVINPSIIYNARLYHELGSHQERNKCALEFKKLDQLYPTWNSSSICML